MRASNEPAAPVGPSPPVDPAVPVDQPGPVDPSGPVDPAVPVDQPGPVDPSGPVDPAVPVDQPGPVDPSGSVGAPGSVDRSGPVGAPRTVGRVAAGLAPPVAAIRVAVRRALAGLPAGPVLVACSGGADSLALAAATAFVAARLGRPAGLVTVDHDLQPGSAERAAEVARWAAGIGLRPVEAVRVTVAGRPGGPEAAAREARYQALVDAARRHRAAALLTGHTRDDQAETVLLALARGAGPRGLAGMPPRRELDGVPLLRPLLDVTREQTRAACAALGLTPWQDPHNTDPSYARARVRADVLPVLLGALGEGVRDNLARTAALVAADTAALDDLARAALAAPALGVGGSTPTGVRTVDGGLSVAALAGLPAAVRTRVLHAWARELGAPPAALSHRHVTALDALVTGWHGQGAVHLPGAIRVVRRAGELTPDVPAR